MREFREVHGCQGEVGRCEEAGPYSVEEHKFGDAVVFIDAEDVDYEAEDGDAEEDLDSPDWVYPGDSGGHYRSRGFVVARRLSA